MYGPYKLVAKVSPRPFNGRWTVYCAKVWEVGGQVGVHTPCATRAEAREIAAKFLASETPQ